LLADAATFRNSVTPPTFVTEGCANATARAANACSNWGAKHQFSPAAIGMPQASPTERSESKSSGGKTGSSNQARSYRLNRWPAAIASAGAH